MTDNEERDAWTSRACGWCNLLAAGWASNTSGDWWPSCGEHGADFTETLHRPDPVVPAWKREVFEIEQEHARSEDEQGRFHVVPDPEPVCVKHLDDARSNAGGWDYGVPCICLELRAARLESVFILSRAEAQTLEQMFMNSLDPKEEWVSRYSALADRLISFLHGLSKEGKSDELGSD